MAELRRRLGQTFTLAELADVYDGALDWARDSLYDALPEDAPPPDTSTVTDAAFQHVRPRRVRLPRRDAAGAPIAVVAGAVVVFAAGIGLGQALDDNATDGRTRRRSCARSTRSRCRRRRARPSP